MVDLLVVLPYLGVFAYLVARGQGMGDRAVDTARRRDEAFRRSVRDAVATSPTDGDDLAKLDALRASGVIDAAEFERMRTRVTT